MRKPLLVDSVYIIALANRRDQYHAQAVTLAEEYAEHPLLITDSILLEVGNALSRGFKAEGVEIIESFLDSEETEIVHLTPNLFSKAFKLYKDHKDKTWSLVDCISFEVMKERNLTQALTSDRHFVQAGFKILMS